MRFLQKLVALPAVAFLVCSAGAQASIERRLPEAAQASLPDLPAPAAPSPSEVRADAAWRQLARRQHYGFRQEVRVQAKGELLRCDLEGVTPTEIFCSEHRVVDGPFRGVFFPRQAYRIPRAEVVDVREGGREGSTALGALIGICAGVGVGSITEQSRTSGGQLAGALILGVFGGLIGHVAPMKGHVVYRQP